MRRTILTIVIIGSVFAGLTTCAQNPQKNTVRNSDQGRDLPVFSGIETTGGIDVYVIQGEPQKVYVIGDEEIVDRIVTEVSEDVLHIYYEKWLLRFRNVKVLVTMKDIKLLKGTGGSDIFSKKQLVVGNLELDASGGSDIDLDVKAIEITGSASGGSDIKLKGAAGYLKVDASGGSDCKAYDLVVAKADVSASGGSDIYIQVDEDLKANASGGSDVHYKGKAKITKVETSGGSDIIKE
jgi:hypothetical protein